MKMYLFISILATMAMFPAPALCSEMVSMVTMVGTTMKDSVPDDDEVAKVRLEKKKRNLRIGESIFIGIVAVVGFVIFLGLGVALIFLSRPSGSPRDSTFDVNSFLLGSLGVILSLGCLVLLGFSLKKIRRLRNGESKKKYRELSKRME